MEVSISECTKLNNGGFKAESYLTEYTKDSAIVLIDKTNKAS